MNKLITFTNTGRLPRQNTVNDEDQKLSELFVRLIGSHDITLLSTHLYYNFT